MASNEFRNDDIERDGFCVIQSVFPMSLLDGLTEEVEMTVANEFTRRADPIPVIRHYVEDVDISTLDESHVLPNIGVPTLEGGLVSSALEFASVSGITVAEPRFREVTSFMPSLLWMAHRGSN